VKSNAPNDFLTFFIFHRVRGVMSRLALVYQWLFDCFKKKIKNKKKALLVATIEKKKKKKSTKLAASPFARRGIARQALERGGYRIAQRPGTSRKVRAGPLARPAPRGFFIGVQRILKVGARDLNGGEKKKNKGKKKKKQFHGCQRPARDRKTRHWERIK
jgi:hypothetical protein